MTIRQLPISIRTPANHAQTRWGWTALCMLLGALLVSVARADDDPTSRVARLSYLQGDVEVLMSSGNADDEDEERDWQEAQVNRPLIAGDRVSTDGRARAELQMGLSNVQIEEETELGLQQLNDGDIELELKQGSINVYLRRRSDDRVQVITGNARVVLREAGNYRITRWDDDVTEVQVRRGDAEVFARRQSYPVKSGEQLTLEGSSRLSVTYKNVAGMDDFDRWAAKRNQRDERLSHRYVSDEVIGYEDLDDYGEWITVAEYGSIWRPTRVAVDWAPYRYGRWIWVSPWGWTWVDDAPWGFAPFHYGRWTRISNRWCWVPGPREQRAVYAPALVAWIGTPNLSIRIGLDSRVSWLPLAPHEVYRPPYRSSERYIRQVNLSNGRFALPDIERELQQAPKERDYRHHDAINVVMGRDFRGATPVQRRLLSPDVRDEPRGHGPAMPNPREVTRVEPSRDRQWQTDERNNDRWQRDRSSRDERNAIRVEPSRPMQGPALPLPNMPPIQNDVPRQRVPTPDLPRMETPRLPSPSESPRQEERRNDNDQRNDWRGARGPWGQPNDNRGVVPINPGSPSNPSNGGPMTGNNQDKPHEQRGHGRFGPESAR